MTASKNGQISPSLKRVAETYAHKTAEKTDPRDFTRKFCKAVKLAGQITPDGTVIEKEDYTLPIPEPKPEEPKYKPLNSILELWK